MHQIGPDEWERVGRVLTDLRLGLPVRLISGERHSLMAAVETLQSRRLQALRALDPGHLAITARRAKIVRAMIYDDDLARLPIPPDAELTWMRAMADPSLDLTHPMKGPFRPLREGAPDLARAALRLCKMAHLLPAAGLFDIAPDLDLPEIQRLDINEIPQGDERMAHITSGRVPLAVARDTRVHVFGHGSDFEEHYAVEIGQPPRDAPVLCRLHSACFTGDILGSLKCDCGAQLTGALGQIAAEGAGVLLYLNQEGRGIGLANKMRAYTLQDQGFDTVEANHRLGFEDDERDFRIGARILLDLGFSSARLLTNNPAKVARMSEAGVQVVERVAHRYGETPENQNYLKTKAEKSGHIL